MFNDLHHAQTHIRRFGQIHDDRLNLRRIQDDIDQFDDIQDIYIAVPVYIGSLKKCGTGLRRRTGSKDDFNQSDDVEDINAVAPAGQIAGNYACTTYGYIDGWIIRIIAMDNQEFFKGVGPIGGKRYRYLLVTSRRYGEDATVHAE